MGGPKKLRVACVSDYVAAQPESHRPTIEALRLLISSIVPEASEKISYGIICFKHHYLLVGIGTTKNAVSFHVMNPRLVSTMEEKLREVPHSGATLHFSPGATLPRNLIADLVRRRVRENEERAAGRSVPRNSPEHRAAALRAADQARDVLVLFEDRHPSDRRPREAIDAITAWALGKRSLGMAEVRRLSLAAHSAARDATSDGARFAARAAGHAVAAWHVPSHAEGASTYAAKALNATALSASTRRRPTAND